MKIDDRLMKLWSRIGSRASFGMAVTELGSEIEELMILTPDVSISAGLERFKRTFPNKFLNVGIAEQNMMGIATGFASEGKKVITTTFAPFQTMRCCEQIRINLGYMQQKICMVGIASGLVLGNLGYTHCCFEDLGVMRSIPGMTILSPADCGETVKALIAALDHDAPVYLRLTGGNMNPMVYKNDYTFEIGKAITLNKGTDLTFFVTGTMVYHSLGAAKILEKEGLSVAVIDMHTIKPIDKEVIKKACDETKLIVTIEEHNIIGGLGSAVSEYKSTLSNAPPQLFIGIPDKYGKSGAYNDLLDKIGLTKEKIAEKVKQELYKGE